MRFIPWVLSLIVLAGPAAVAGPAGQEGRSITEESAATRWDAPNPFEPVELTLPRRPAAPEWRPLEFRLGELPPATLALRVDLGAAATFYVSADLSGGLPRLDAVDGETYFAPGIEVQVAPGLRAFAEDFQPASGVVGGGAEADGERWVPERSWDGHQVTVGLRWLPLPGVTVEAGAVGYALSPSRRPDAVGATAQVALRF